jgi:hypothetical protein
MKTRWLRQRKRIMVAAWLRTKTRWLRRRRTIMAAELQKMAVANGGGRGGKSSGGGGQRHSGCGGEDNDGGAVEDGGKEGGRVRWRRTMMAVAQQEIEAAEDGRVGRRQQFNGSVG